MTPVLLTFGIFTPGSLELFLIKVLAVIGAAALGGLGCGLLARVLSRSLTTRRIPIWPLRIIRGLGALAVGWIAALFLFGGGGSGLGGSGGWGFGGQGGSGNGEGGERTMLTATTAPFQESPGKADTTEDKVLSIEILVEGHNKDQQWYREKGQPKTYNLEEVRKLIQRRRQEQPALKKVEIVLYGNSSDQFAGTVQALEKAVADLKLTPVLELPERETP